MNSDATETAIDAIEIMEQKKFDKQEILKLLKALDDRNREITKQDIAAWKQEMITRKQAIWLVSMVGTILAFLILTYPGALIKFLTSGASPLS